MNHDIILRICDPGNDNSSVLAALEKTGCEVVSTESLTEGVAFLYIMHSVAAVVLDRHAREQASFDVMQSMSKIRPDVPVMLLCDDQIVSSASGAEGCVTANELSGLVQAHTKV